MVFDLQTTFLHCKNTPLNVMIKSKALFFSDWGIQELIEELRIDVAAIQRFTRRDGEDDWGGG